MQKLSRECGQLNIPVKLPSLEEVLQWLSSYPPGIWRLKIIAAAKKVCFSIDPYLPQSKLKVAIYPIPTFRADYRNKSLPYNDRLDLLAWAKKQGLDEVLTVDHQGYILEGAVSNVFWREGEAWYFIDRSLPYYEGLTQELLIKEAKGKVHFVKIKPEQVRGKSLFFCNALRGIVPAFF